MSTKIPVTLTPEQRLELEGAASMAGTTLAGYMRTAALEKSAEQRRLFKGRVTYVPPKPEPAAKRTTWTRKQCQDYWDVHPEIHEHQTFEQFVKANS